MLLDNEAYKMVWDRVYTQLGFRPDSRGRNFPPFHIRDSHAVYAVDGMTAAQMEALEDAVRTVFLEVTAEGERLYALDWQHSAFLFNPRDPETQKSLWVEDEAYPGGGYQADFPTFYPDGDYYFFLDEHFRFGFLGHPWRQEVWVFGEPLVQKFKKRHRELGWTRVK